MIMRTFISVRLNGEALGEVKKVQKELTKSNLYEGKLTDENNLHLTLKFLGEVDEEKIEEVKERLRKVKLKKFKVKLGEVGVFSKEFVRIIWIKLEGVDALQRKVDKALHGRFTHEKRFMGHITIARVKSVKDKTAFLELLNKIKVKEISFEVDKFELMKSELTSYGPKYSVIEEYGLV